ncbi:baseplate J/gp47 family protein [Acetobacter sp. DsW_063]|uniref:baseplate J/gp47 family protein n=1 Tax=Acetobacter sp. DsW_063 TaxID=1514894 RepID=UPI000A3ACFCD|nr:baseplate J/gp47 family protein [Acetobacter sp. DsW_063]OUJ14208.1 hypothetical protein HK28_00580 [Acetobacter sp. DsW_063]
MTLSIPTSAEIVRRFAAALQAMPVTADDGTSVVLDANVPGSVEQVLAAAFSLEMTGVYRYARDYCLELMVTTATENGLLASHALQWKTPRIGAQAAVGNVLATTTAAVVFAVGQTMTVDGTVTWSVTAETSLASGVTGSVPVQATTTGTAGNLAAGTTLTLVTPVTGVSSIIVDSSGLAGGAAIEAAESWRARILAAIRNPPGGGTAADYKKWATDAGAGYVNVVGGWLGLGTVGVIVAMPGRVAPTDAQLAQIQAYIDDQSRKVVRSNATVVAATIVQRNVVASINPDTTTARAATSSAVSAYYAGTGLGDTLYQSQLSDAFSSVVGETSHLITSPAANIVQAANELSVFGSISWSANT